MHDITSIPVLSHVADNDSSPVLGLKSSKNLDLMTCNEKWGVYQITYSNIVMVLAK